MATRSSNGQWTHEEWMDWWYWNWWKEGEARFELWCEAEQKGYQIGHEHGYHKGFADGINATAARYGLPCPKAVAPKASRDGPY